MDTHVRQACLLLFSSKAYVSGRSPQSQRAVRLAVWIGLGRRQPASWQLGQQQQVLWLRISLLGLGSDLELQRHCVAAMLSPMRYWGGPFMVPTLLTQAKPCGYIP